MRTVGRTTTSATSGADVPLQLGNRRTQSPARARCLPKDAASSLRAPGRPPAGRASPAEAVPLALSDARRRLISVAAISGAINMLTLSGPIYMLQVYDRVLASRSLATLFGLSAMVLAAYLLQGYLDALRARMLARIGALFDTAMQEPIYAAMSGLPLKGTSAAAAQQPLRDLELVRAFLSGMGPTAFLDMPWIPIFVLALFLFHPAIGVAATAGAALIVATTVIADRQAKKFAISAVERGAKRAALADAIRRNAEVIRALGMRDRFMHRWRQLNEAHIVQTTRMRDVETDIGAFAKILRYVLQSAVLGIGAALVLGEQASGGIMIASSIMMGRALAPIEIVLGTWKQLNAARHAVMRLTEMLPLTAVPPTPAITLPRPAAHLVVRDLTVGPPGSSCPVVRNVSFALRAGAGMALLGASGSGKSSLARAMVGIWQPSHGEVRLDGARLDQWQPDDLGHHIGYLPQEVALFDATIAENICRFEQGACEERVLEAAMIAGAHELVVSLPNGYATRIGEGGALLSAGQRQRIGLARAVYGNPFLLVLDEPNANLDAEGEAALARAIKLLRSRKAIVVVISHRLNALAALDAMLVLNKGSVLAFGQRSEVLAVLTRGQRGARLNASAPPSGQAPEGGPARPPAATMA
jgi:ATP-binding cassette subfamily C protein PrsD